MALTSESTTTILPGIVDNSKKPWLRPVFNQNGGCCDQPDSTLRQLNTSSRRSNPKRELPEQYWIDIMTEQPEGYVVDANGDVHLHSAEALTWLASVVNGMNGQEPDDFNGKKVTLDANVDMSAANWIPIADGSDIGSSNDSIRFCGSFNGNGFIINGLIPTYNPVPNNFESFLGALYGATIENVVLRHVYSQGRCKSDGKFFGRTEPLELENGKRPSVINRCYIEIDEIYRDGLNQDAETAFFGHKNNGIITNCMVKCHNVDHPDHIPGHVSLFDLTEGLFVYDNCQNGIIRNCASVSDSLIWLEYFGGMAITNSGLIENCYSYIEEWFGGEPCWWPPGPRFSVACFNLGTIRHCYFNTFKYSGQSLFFDDEPVWENGGCSTLQWAVPFEPTPDFSYPYWIFADTVPIVKPNNIVFNTLTLADALNSWVYVQENSEDYSSWCSPNSGNILPKHLPEICDLDIWDMPEPGQSGTSFNIYPNPSTGRIDMESAAAEVQVYNAAGQLVKTFRNTGTIRLDGLPKGIYALRIQTTENETVCKKVLLK